MIFVSVYPHNGEIIILLSFLFSHITANTFISSIVFFVSIKLSGSNSLLYSKNPVLSGVISHIYIPSDFDFDTDIPYSLYIFVLGCFRSFKEIRSIPLLFFIYIVQLPEVGRSPKEKPCVSCFNDTKILSYFLLYIPNSSFIYRYH